MEDDAPLKGVSYSCTVSQAVMTSGPNRPPAQSVPSSEHHLPPGGMSPAPPAEPMLLQRQWSCKPRKLQGPALPPLPETQPELSPVPYANSLPGSVCATPSDCLPVDAALSALAAEHRGPPSAEHSRCTLSAEHSAPLSAEQSSRCTVSSSSSGSAAALLHTHAGNASSECSSSRASSAEILWDGAMHYLLETDVADMWVDALMRSGAEQLLLRAGSSSCFTGPAPAGGEQLLLRAGSSSCFTGPAPAGGEQLLLLAGSSSCFTGPPADKQQPLHCLLGLPTTLPEKIQLHKRIGKGSFGKSFSGGKRENCFALLLPPSPPLSIVIAPLA